MAIEKRDIELWGGKATVQIDNNALFQLVKECVRALEITHRDFPYMDNFLSVSVHDSRINIFLLHPSIDKGPKLIVDIYWRELGHIYPFEYMELGDSVFPNDISAESRLNIQKHITRKIWEEFKD